MFVHDVYSVMHFQLKFICTIIQFAILTSQMCKKKKKVKQT